MLLGKSFSIKVGRARTTVYNRVNNLEKLTANDYCKCHEEIWRRVVINLPTPIIRY